MRQNTKNLISLSLVLVILLTAAYFIYPPAKSTKLGLDLRGGLSVLLTAQESEGAPVTEEAMEQAMLVIRERVDGLGVAEPLIQRQGLSSISVQLPGVDDPQKALEIIGKTAQLEFKEVLGLDGKNYVLGETLLTGDKLKNAMASFDEYSKPKVDIEFTPEGTEIFADVTSRLVGKQLAIVLDGVVMSAPTVQSVITDGNANITGSFTIEEAKELALVLQTGSLPVNLVIDENRTVGPTLGKDSLREGLVAGGIGLLLVALYMIAYYRGLGLITTMALVVFGIIFWGIIAIIGRYQSWTLTLPGIAGMILSIGMAADSSIVIFERFKEEIKGGKSIRTGADSGFRNAIKTMIDANFVTLAAVIFLFFLAVGPVRGFAFTLMLGVFIDLFTAFFFTRPMLALLSSTKLFKNPLILGVKEVQN